VQIVSYQGIASQLAEKVRFARFREGHEFHSCRQVAENVSRFSACGTLALKRNALFRELFSAAEKLYLAVAFGWRSGLPLR
jgi:hypothetical protein